MLGTILLVILILLLVGALPTWGYSGGWGYYPSGGIGTVLLIALVVLYALIASAVAVARLGDAGALAQLAFFIFSGLLWILPAMAVPRDVTTS